MAGVECRPVLAWPGWRNDDDGRGGWWWVTAGEIGGGLVGETEVRGVRGEGEGRGGWPVRGPGGDGLLLFLSDRSVRIGLYRAVESVAGGLAGDIGAAVRGGGG